MGNRQGAGKKAKLALSRSRKNVRPWQGCRTKLPVHLDLHRAPATQSFDEAQPKPQRAPPQAPQQGIPASCRPPSQVEEKKKRKPNQKGNRCPF